MPVTRLILAAVLLAGASCDAGGPPFAHEIVLHTDAGEGFTVRADGEIVSPEAGSGAYRIIREYASYDRAREADPIAVQVEHEGMVTLNGSYFPDDCDGSAPP